MMTTPIVDYPIPKTALEDIHTFIGVILIIFAVKIHIICADETVKATFRKWDTAVDWIRKNWRD